MPESSGLAAARYAGPVIDAHHHVWDLERNRYPWLLPDVLVPHRYGDYNAVKRSYLPADYRRDTAGLGVVSSVYMEAEWNPADPLGETRYVEELSAEGGVPGAMAAQAWLDAPTAAEVVAAQAASPIVRSVRHKPGGPATADEARLGGRTLLSDPLWRRGYAALATHGLHFELQTPWWNLHEAADLAAEVPETLIVVNHAGVLLDREPATVAGWREAMAGLAAHANVVVKASGLCVAGVPWSSELVREPVLTLVELFGADRVMFGSNFPVDGMFTDYAGLLDAYLDATASLSAAQQRAIFHDTADRVYAPDRIAGA
ncbi:amidohydrolase family protein [Plantibacter flavus]|uniref:amidohydrolase family protein n=1 Tax=Plantibacter flavus TaxID=150123 RepID=UPI001F0AD9A3|nr:amidohydrolase family protein [Plantibacter flavus]